MSTLLEVKNLKAYYRTPRGEDVQAVDGVSLELKAGEVLGIAGESGCGKTTLSQVLALTVQKPLYIKSGEVLLEGQNALALDRETMRREIRGKTISVVPQGAMNSLNPTLKVRNVVIDVMRDHFPKMSRQEAVERGRERLEMLGLPARVLDEYPHQLSGGMKQRIITVISSLLDPKLLVVDEPTSALDVSSQKVVIKLLLELLDKEIIQSIVFITHELPLLRHVADRIAIMYAGRLAEIGPMEEIIFSPKHPYTQGLVGSVLVPEPGMKDRRITGIAGRPPDMKNPPSGCRFRERCPHAMEVCKQDPATTHIEGRDVWCWLHQEKPTVTTIR
jgi:peptide/nickel transport system ATP-binding protein